MTRFPDIWKKPHFWPILPIVGAMRIFLKNLAFSCTTSSGFLSPCQKLEKNNDQIPRKLQDKHTDVWKYEQTDPIS